MYSPNMEDSKKWNSVSVSVSDCNSFKLIRSREREIETIVNELPR